MPKHGSEILMKKLNTNNTMPTHTTNPTTGDEITIHLAKNQLAYNQFWKEHSNLDLYQSTKFLALRDLFQLIDKYLLQTNRKSKYRILDFGCGNGETAQVVNDLFVKAGFEVELVCVDINERNLNVAKQKNPNGTFYLIDKNSLPDEIKDFDLIICNFVLLENTQADMAKILMNIQMALNDPGIAVVTHNTAKVYDDCNEWVSFNTKYDENKRDLFDSQKEKYTRCDGKPVRKDILDKERKKVFTFSDFFYRRRTYKNAFLTANLKIVCSHKPLGKSEDHITWKSEANVPPYRIDILQRNIQVGLGNPYAAQQNTRNTFS
jgi:SAM-dependent methyltransferase